jgi:hypothetical protein
VFVTAITYPNLGWCENLRVIVSARVVARSGEKERLRIEIHSQQTAN